ncbi:hypothetical protein QS257_04255 [Terrilactibacillus sp. S3-3]|nr:hypothetical protein QS257_04255 [Terrilactibacillus sp. S3-3]
MDKLADYALREDLSLIQAIEEIEQTGVSKRAAKALREFAGLIGNWSKMQDFFIRHRSRGRCA